ncbi:MAG: PEP-CTERM sorting domain-containing protein, partial [Porticoccus sp.]|nr:PEP-CTERM sorting domain-containing protein [Porticoccus sp.]
FSDQAGLDFEVSFVSRGGSDIYFHLEHKLGVIGRRPYDKVVMHGYSTLDKQKPGDPNPLIQSTAEMAEFLRGINSDVEIYLTATWSRADLIYPDDRSWTDTPIEKMALDIRAGYNKALAAPGVVSVNPVGEAWTRAMESGVADPNPYDGIDFGKVDLWTYDHYHASTYGYYLEALVVFGNLTGLDPRSLGENECSGYELGMSRSEVWGLQQAAFDQLARESEVTAAPLDLPSRVNPKGCNSVGN